MWHQLWIPLLIPTLIIKSNCDVNRTDTDVFVRHSHAEAEYMNRHEQTTVTEKQVETTAVKTTVRVSKPPTTRIYDDATDNVMFIPNKVAQRREEEDDDEANSYKIKDIMMMKSMNDVMNKDFHVEKLVDNPNEDIMFITGKNHDYEKQPRQKDSYSYRRNDEDLEEYTDEDFLRRPKLNCTDLDCNNTIRSICGAKLVNKEWRYRLFLNDCYFRKVNCGFKYEINRYRQVTGDKCKTIGANYHERPFFRPKPFLDKKPEEAEELPPRTSLSRRSMTINYNGQFCSHLCPVSCPEEYDPQCAISGTGQRRVFLNHCKMDHNSCFYGVVWHKRPLAECVGGKKADLRQNRGFIGWMQRVGIVDNKGRLVLE